MVPPRARLIVVVRAVVLAGAAFAGAVVLASAAVVLGGSALAQRVISAKSGLVLFVLGRVSVEGGPLKAGESYRQLKDGESLSIERGRAEVLLNPGIILTLGDMSRLRMDDVQLTDACVSLESGSAVVAVNHILKTDRIRLLAGGNVILMKQEGVYRLDIAQSRLRVFSGRAEVRRDGSPGMVAVKRGQSVSLDDGLTIAKFDPKETDSLQRWANARSRTLGPRNFGPRPQPPRVGWRSDPPSGPGSSTSSNQF
jgi:hypothetical protein